MKTGFSLRAGSCALGLTAAREDAGQIVAKARGEDTAKRPAVGH
jgi:hypothetical protein